MFVKMKIPNSKNYYRIDIDEVVTYSPCRIKSDIPLSDISDFIACSDLILKNGLTLTVEKKVEQIDQMMKDHGMIVE